MYIQRPHRLDNSLDVISANAGPYISITARVYTFGFAEAFTLIKDFNKSCARMEWLTRTLNIGFISGRPAKRHDASEQWLRCSSGAWLPTYQDMAANDWYVNDSVSKEVLALYRISMNTGVPVPGPGSGGSFVSAAAEKD